VQPAWKFRTDADADTLAAAHHFLNVVDLADDHHLDRDDDGHRQRLQSADHDDHDHTDATAYFNRDDGDHRTIPSLQ
jgi:hypothetical protein